VLRQNFAASWHGPSRSYDFRLRRRDGFEVWVKIAANLLFDQDGAFLGVLDVHRYKRTQRAEDAQKAIEKQLALLFEASSALLASPESTRRPKNSGALSFVMAESPRRFSQADLEACRGTSQTRRNRCRECPAVRRVEER